MTVRRIRVPFAALLAAAFLLAVALPAAALESDDLDGYADRVTEARVLLEQTLAEEPLDAAAAVTLSGRLRELLPAGERVSAGGATIVVDDSQLTGLVGRLASDPVGALEAGVPDDLLDHLRSLERAIGAQGTAVRSDPEALSRLLADRNAAGRSAISSFFGDLVDRLGKAIVGWWESVGASPATGRVLTIATVTVLVGLTLLLVVLVTRALVRARRGTGREARRAGRPAAPGAVVAAAEGLPEDPLAYADECAAAGDRRAALRALFGGAARSLQESGFIRHARTHTNGEVLAEVRGSGDPALGAALAALCAPFERAWYGHHEPDERTFVAARGEYLTIQRAIEAARRERDAA